MSDARITPEMRACARRIMKALPADDDLERLYADIVSLAGDVDEAADLAEEEATVKRIMEPEEARDLVGEIRVEGTGLVSVAKALLSHTGDDPDAGLLSLLQQRVLSAARLVWHIESNTIDAEQPAAWDALVQWDARILDTLPTLALAFRGLDTPNYAAYAPASDFAVWRPPVYRALAVGTKLVEWAEEASHV